ncbi:MAG: tetratricopeptide repeat protein [Cycloclasticus sp.]|nr:tetratricopeptide repeat protein [Cycloclasticus sp.]
MTDNLNFIAPMAQPSPQMTLQQAMQLAIKQHAEGHLPQAASLLQRILQAAPQNAQALHLLAVITQQSGHTEKAISMLAQAIAISPNNGLFYSNICEMCRQVKRIDDAIAYGEKAVALTPKSATAHGNLGIAYFDNKDMGKALACQQKALELNPKLVAALNNMGSIARINKDRDAAIDYYQQVLKIAPQHAESLNNLGAVLTETEQPEEAVKTLLEALKVKPNYAEAHCNIGTAFLTLEQLDKAEIGFKKALSLKPDYAEAFQGLAKTYQENRDLTNATSMANKALALKPDSAAVHALLGGIYSESGYPDKAEAAFKKALELEADFIGAHLGYGHLHMEQGDMDKAEACFRTALSLDEDNLGAMLSIAQVKKVSLNDGNFKQLTEKAAELDDMMETKAIPLHFALGKSYDDVKQYDLAFKHYLEGCRLKRKRTQYDATENDKRTNKISQFFSASNIDTMRGEGCSSTTPIFVLGMPRSGTTLTEQIIASHPDVHGAGELPDLMRLSNQPNDWETAGYPDVLKGLNHAQLKALGEKYVAGLQERAPEAKHITDKMPANFTCIGLIHLMLPNAKIVHVKRSPVDTCLSGFSRLFNKSQHQSYNLAEMGRYYRNYFDLMQHWREVLPVGSFYDIQYEDLVANTEKESRALIDYCGLEWDDACLDFHKTERSIRTASVTQVRQPIYTTSVERWRAYEDHLGPLFDALGDLAPNRKD